MECPISDSQKKIFPKIIYKFNGKEDHGTIFFLIFFISICKNLPILHIQKIQACELNRAPDGSLSSRYIVFILIRTKLTPTFGTQKSPTANIHPLRTVFESHKFISAQLPLGSSVTLTVTMRNKRLGRASLTGWYSLQIPQSLAQNWVCSRLNVSRCMNSTLFPLTSKGTLFSKQSIPSWTFQSFRSPHNLNHGQRVILWLDGDVVWRWLELLSSSSFQYTLKSILWNSLMLTCLKHFRLIFNFFTTIEHSMIVLSQDPWAPRYFPCQPLNDLPSFRRVFAGRLSIPLTWRLCYLLEQTLNWTFV